MRLRPLQSLVLAALLYVVLAPQFACTVIGALAGGAADATTRPIPAGDAVTVKPGRHLTVTLRNGERFTGVFRDTSRLSDSEYDASWQRWLASPGHVSSVAPGDSITLVDSRGEWPATFLGYEYRSLEVKPADGEMRRVPLATLRTLRGPDRREWDGTTLEALDAAGAIPSRMAIELDVVEQLRGISSMGAVRRSIPLNEIQTISVSHGTHGALVGAVIGLAADVLVVTSIRRSQNAGFGCALLWLSLQASAEPTEVQLTDRPYDRLAGRFVEPALGTNTSSRRGAPVR